MLKRKNFVDAFCMRPGLKRALLLSSRETSPLAPLLKRGNWK